MTKQILLTAVAGLMFAAVPFTAHAQGSPGKQFKNSMNQASKARLANDGSTVFNMNVKQDTDIESASMGNSVVTLNNLSIDDSVIANLDVDQKARIDNLASYNGHIRGNTIDATHMRSRSAKVDQKLTINGATVANGAVNVNGVSVR